MRFSTALTTLAVVATVGSTPAFAQQTDSSTPQVTAKPCMNELNGFSTRMRNEGFWVTGLGTPYSNVDAQNTVTSPWKDNGRSPALASPRTQIRELYGAAQVLSYREDADGCKYLVSVLNQTYDDYVSQLKNAGVAADDISSWRGEQIAISKPVDEMDMGRINVDELTGTDVRNVADKELGSVSDVILDPSSGEISYAVVARGGFLGFGEDYVAVPWDEFRATRGLNTLILDVSEQELAKAPTIDPDAYSDPNKMQQQNMAIDNYWS